MSFSHFPIFPRAASSLPSRVSVGGFGQGHCWEEQVGEAARELHKTGAGSPPCP